MIFYKTDSQRMSLVGDRGEQRELWMQRTTSHRWNHHVRASAPIADW